MNITATMILIAAALIVMQVLLTARGSREVRTIWSALMRDAKKRAHKTFSVIIPLTKRAETIFPLLDHLYGQQYDKLQVVVVAKQTAGRNAEKDLQAYRRAHKVKGLKVVRYAAGMKIDAAASGQYVLQLQPSYRLTARFFEIASFILETYRPDALAVRTILLPGQTFAQAHQAGLTLFRSIISSLMPQALPFSHGIVRRVVLARGESALPARVASHQFGMYEDNSAAWYRISLKSLAITIIAGLFVFGALVAGYFMSDALLLPVIAAFLGGAYVIFMAIIFTAIRGYRFVDYLNMVFFLPLAPLYAMIVGVARGVRAAIGVSRRQESLER